MKDKISIIGPFPLPIHGMSLANQIIYDSFINESTVDVDKFDITLSTTLKSKNDQGKFKLAIIIRALVNLIKMFSFIIRRRGGVFYFTPPQSALGYLRLSPAIILSWFVGRQCIVHFHGARFKSYYEETNLLFRMLIRTTFNCVDSFVLLGETIKTSHSCLLGAQKIIVCANGVNLPLEPVANATRNDSKVTVLFLSNLMKDKGFFEFADAISKLPTDKYCVHIAGAIEESNREEIERIIEGLANVATYHGTVSGEDKHRLLSTANLFVLPSYDEGQPMSILEAYSYGCTVITTDVGGIPDVFTDAINGKSVRVGNVDDIHQAITNMTTADLERYQKNNVEHFFRLYTASAFCHRILNICRRV